MKVNKLWYVVVFLCLCLFTMLVLYSKKPKEIAKIIRIESDSLYYYKDRFNNENAQKEQIQGTIDELRITNKKQIDDLKNRLGVKDRQIQSLNETIFYESTKIVSPLKFHDTIIIPTTKTEKGQVLVGTTFGYKDSCIKVLGLLTKDSVKLWYDSKVTVDFDMYWKRPHKILGIAYGKPVHYIDGYSPNKNVHIVGLNSIYVKPKTPSKLKWFLVCLIIQSDTQICSLLR